MPFSSEETDSVFRSNLNAARVSLEKKLREDASLELGNLMGEKILKAQEGAENQQSGTSMPTDSDKKDGSN